jgi:hypothetical protein
MALSKTLQYIVSGFLVVYIVFFTRPAPTAVSNILASPVAQLAALGVVIYVGASVSLLVAVVAALAVVLSTPVREYAGKRDDKTMSKKKGKEGLDEDKKEANPTLDAAKDLSKMAAVAGTKKATTKSGDSAEKTVEPAGDKVADKKESTGSEKFSLMNAAPF